MELKCCEIDEHLLYEFLYEQFDEAEWSARTFNNHLDFFKTLFNRLHKLEKKEFGKINYKLDLSDTEEYKIDKAEKNRYYTPAVAEKVKNELTKDPVLFNYCKWIFYSCMRPKEIRLLQVQHIDLNSQQIKVIAPTAKTGDRFVPISDELYDLIIQMGLTKLPLNFYPFGKNGVPSWEMCSRDYFTTRYKVIKDDLGLDDKYTLYGWKHTRVLELLIAGFTDAEVMSLTGHTNYESFMAYKRSFVLDAKAMQGKTVSF